MKLILLFLALAQSCYFFNHGNPAYFMSCYIILTFNFSLLYDAMGLGAWPLESKIVWVEGRIYPNAQNKIFPNE